MGFGIKELLILLVIVALVFGTKRLRNMGGDIGSAVRGFKDAVKDGDKDDGDTPAIDDKAGRTMDAEVESREESAAKRD